MVTTPRQLPDLSETEKTKIYQAIFDDSKKSDPHAAVYDDIFTVFFPTSLTDLAGG